MSDNTLRLMEVHFTEDFFTEQFIIGSEPQFFSIVEGLPEDAELVGVRYDYERNRVIFTYRHESFKQMNVKEWLAGETPELMLVIKDKYQEIKNLFKMNGIEYNSGYSER